MLEAVNVSPNVRRRDLLDCDINGRQDMQETARRKCSPFESEKSQRMGKEVEILRSAHLRNIFIATS